MSQRGDREKAMVKYKATRLSQNALSKKRPDLVEEWDYELNKDLTPDKITASSGEKVWWKCRKCNHSWQATVAHRNDGRGCPVCAGRIVVAGINDLATINPRLATEWDYESNKLTPQQVTARNNIKAAWICSVCGWHWKSAISTRNNGAGCPNCHKNFHTSLPEQIVFFYLKKGFPDSVNGYDIRYGGKVKEVDIYIPSLKIAIEYDGSRWHKDAKRDLLKTQFLNNAGIELIRIREKGCTPLNDLSHQIWVEYNSSNYEYLIAGIDDTIQHINETHGTSVNIPINLKEDFNTILGDFETYKKEMSLAHRYPDIASEWNYSKNGLVTPHLISAGSNKRFWWICNTCGYSWQTAIKTRVNGHNCPCCSGNVVRQGYNDLQTMCPDLSLEWDRVKNTELTPETISYRSNKSVWWLCHKCGFSWSARLADRSAGIGCPACAGKIAVAGRTDLATTNPKLAEEWDYSKNNGLTPQMVVGGSNKKVWWICGKCSHSWRADIYSRNSRGHGCPVCGRKNRKRSINPNHILSLVSPDLASEWDFARNGELHPDHITFGSGINVHWICQSCGHHYQASPNDRANGHGCPLCAVQKQTESWRKRCLERNNFHQWCQEHEKEYLIQEWDCGGNSGQIPKDFSAGSNKRVQWVCGICGHKWSATISNRTRGSGCPNCYNLRRKSEKNTSPAKGTNALPVWCKQNDREDLLFEWDDKKNKYPPDHYTFGSHVKVWWKCTNGHEWLAEIKSRTIQGNKCKKCYQEERKKLLK